MKQKIQSLLAVCLVVVGMGTALSTPAGAINVFNRACRGDAADSAVCKDKGEKLDPVVQTVIGILLWAIGIISVIMIIVGGIKYVISSGDSGQIKSARETIIYAVAGLVVALAAYAIVRFVIGAF